MNRTQTLQSLGVRSLGVALLAGGLVACATADPGPRTRVYAMPTDLSQTLPPGDAHPTRAGELAEGALHLLNPDRPGGPDYLGAARMCLLAMEVADPVIERDLCRSCQRVAVRSALRSGDRDLYIDTVNRWERSAPRNERGVGELALHLAIRDRLSDRPPARNVPAEVKRLMPRVEESR